MQSRRRKSLDIPSLRSDELLKIFSKLPPISLARCCLVCTYWNKTITNSTLWLNHRLEAVNHLLQLVSSAQAAGNVILLNDEIHEETDQKASYAKVQHKILLNFGSVHIKEWRGHSKRVECCRFKMEVIMTGSSDGVVSVWSPTSSICLATYIVPNKARVVDLQFDENKIVAVAGTEIYIWNREKGCLLRHIKGHDLLLHSMCDVDPEILVGCSDGTIRVFDMYSGRCARILRQHHDRVTCLVVDVSASQLMSGSADGTVKLCDYVTGHKICCLLPSFPPTEVLGLHLLSLQNKLVGCTSKGDVYAWDIRRQKLLWSVRMGPNAIYALHSPIYDPTTLVIGSINGLVTILDTRSGKPLRRFAIAVDKRQNRHSLGRSMAVELKVGADIESASEDVMGRTRSPPILCLNAGMTRIVTSHPDGMIRIWKFGL